jgi:hypothetical protein
MWERLSASMIAAGKPLPQTCKRRLHPKFNDVRCFSSREVANA